MDSPELVLERTDKGEVWRLIFEDLEFAATYIPVKSQMKSDVGRITKGAAYAFGLVQLCMLEHTISIIKGTIMNHICKWQWMRPRPLWNQMNIPYIPIIVICFYMRE